MSWRQVPASSAWAEPYSADDLEQIAKLIPLTEEGHHEKFNASMQTAAIRLLHGVHKSNAPRTAVRGAKLCDPERKAKVLRSVLEPIRKEVDSLESVVIRYVVVNFH